MNNLLKLPVLDKLDSGTHKEEHLQSSFVFHCHNQKFTVAGYFTPMPFAREHFTLNSAEIYVYLRGGLLQYRISLSACSQAINSVNAKPD